MTSPKTLDDQLAALESDAWIQRFRESRKRLAADPYRPRYHFSSPENYMNDPNGLCQWRGIYHMFYQFKPAGSDRVHWGHAVSADLARWRDLPIAIYPDAERDCFSGQTLVERDRAIAIYHGTEYGNCVATASDPLLLEWAKHPNNPVIPGTLRTLSGEPGAEYRVFDPCIWKERDGFYYSLSGAYQDGERGADAVGVAHLFQSADLSEWRYLGPMVEDAFFGEPGEDIAVPNFWRIGRGKRMLLAFSHKRGGRGYIGEYDERAHRFAPQSHARMNYGPWVTGSLHAPSATVDDSGRFIAIFNTHSGRRHDDTDEIMTLPRHYWLDENDDLRMSPVAEIETLRQDHQSVAPMTIRANSDTPLGGIGGKSIELRATIEPGGAREVGFHVLRSPDGAERTRISFYPDDHRRFGIGSLQIDVSESSIGADALARSAEIGPLKLSEGEPLELRIFIDRSVIEVFANDRQCLTVRAYPALEASAGVSIFARGGDARLASLDIWEMETIWGELGG